MIIKNKLKAVLVGIFILVAYGVLIGTITDSKVWIMIGDVISGLAVIGIAVLMFPFFKVFSKKISFGYLSLKILEGVLMIISGILFLNNSFQFIRDIIYNQIHIYVFILGGFFFYYLLYKTKLIPRFISIWGGVATFTLLVATIFKLVGLRYPVLDTLLILIITNEVFLAVWLMIKGFNIEKK
jgi:hypothetical protein